MLKRFGKLSFQEVLDPAAQYAEEGFSISERIAHDWRLPDVQQRYEGHFAPFLNRRVERQREQSDHA